MLKIFFIYILVWSKWQNIEYCSTQNKETSEKGAVPETIFDDDENLYSHRNEADLLTRNKVSLADGTFWGGYH